MIVALCIAYAVLAAAAWIAYRRLERRARRGEEKIDWAYARMEKMRSQESKVHVDRLRDELRNFIGRDDVRHAGMEKCVADILELIKGMVPQKNIPEYPETMRQDNATVLSRR